jgi:hypothetical protein
VITVSTTAQSVLASAGFQYYCAVESWLGGTLLADSIPVDSGGEESDRGIRIPERVSLTVPRLADGFDWSPNGDRHPLAANGQQLFVKLGIGLAQGAVEWFARGRYLIHDSEVSGDAVDVTAVGLLSLIEEAKLVSPFQPAGGATIASTLRALIEPALVALIDTSIVDRSVPSSIAYDEDRLAAVLELLDAWPAVATVDPQGFLRVSPATQSTTSQLTLTDGVGGTVIKAAGNSTRDGAYNTVVARGTASDGSQVQGVGTLTIGAKAINGPFNPLPVPMFFSSPLVTTVAQANAAAGTIVARLSRQTSREYRVTMVPNPTIQVGDVVTLTGVGLCTVEALTLPYTAPPGQLPEMVLTARTLA